jgi:hypothetical protein
LEEPTASNAAKCIEMALEIQIPGKNGALIRTTE